MKSKREISEELESIICNIYNHFNANTNNNSKW